MNAKTILITGASRGIGEETAYRFAREGWNLILTYNQGKSETARIEKKCKELGATSVKWFELDLTREKDIAQLSSKIKKLDWLVNNAGIFIPKPLLQQTEEEISTLLRTNLEGTIRMVHALLPRVREGIINVSSAAGVEAYENMAPYCASKFGLRGFTQACALEHPKLKWLSVNPGMTATRMTGFRGVHPQEVGKIIWSATQGKYRIRNGGDVNVEEILERRK